MSMRAFEIHTYNDGKWKIDSIFDDRELALFEARRVDEGSRHSGVRVIEENYDELSDLTTTRTIFRGGTVDRPEKAIAGSPAAKSRGGARRGAGARQSGNKRRSRKNQNSSSLLIPVLILGGLIIVGLVALFGLKALPHLR
jgi:hypothetical protein